MQKWHRVQSVMSTWQGRLLRMGVAIISAGESDSPLYRIYSDNNLDFLSHALIHKFPNYGKLRVFLQTSCWYRKVNAFIRSLLLSLVKVEQMEQWPPALMTRTTAALGSKPQFLTWTTMTTTMTMMKTTKMTNRSQATLSPAVIFMGFIVYTQAPTPRLLLAHTFNFPSLFLSWRALRSRGFKGGCWFLWALSAVWLRLLNQNIVLVQVFGPDISVLFCLLKKKTFMGLWSCSTMSFSICWN